MLLIKNVVFIVSGFFLGIFATLYWTNNNNQNQKSEPAAFNKEIISQKINIPIQDGKYIVSSDELRLLLTDVVRTELSTYLSAHPPTEKSKNIDRAVNANAREIMNEPTKKAYETAATVLDDVIATGGFDAYSAKEFIDRLNPLPHDKAMELRARHMDAVNRGLMNSPYPPEEFLNQE